MGPLFSAFRSSAPPPNQSGREFVVDETLAKQQFLAVVARCERYTSCYTRGQSFSTDEIVSASPWLSGTSIRDWHGADTEIDSASRCRVLVGISLQFMRPSGKWKSEGSFAATLVCIDLSRHTLEGTFDLTSVSDLTALTKLDLTSGNGALDIVLDCAILPRSLRALAIGGNRIVGSLVTTDLPPMLERLWLSPEGGGATLMRHYSLPRSERLVRIHNVPDFTTLPFRLQSIRLNDCAFVIDGKEADSVLLDLTRLPASSFSSLDCLRNYARLRFVIDSAMLPDRFQSHNSIWYRYIEEYILEDVEGRLVL